MNDLYTMNEEYTFTHFDYMHAFNSMHINRRTF